MLLTSEYGYKVCGKTCFAWKPTRLGLETNTFDVGDERIWYWRQLRLALETMETKAFTCSIIDEP